LRALADFRKIIDASTTQTFFTERPKVFTRKLKGAFRDAIDPRV